MIAKLEEQVRTSTATAGRLLRKGRSAMEDGMEEATHRIKRDPLTHVTTAFAAGTVVGMLVGLLLRRGGNRGS